MNLHLAAIFLSVPLFSLGCSSSSGGTPAPAGNDASTATDAPSSHDGAPEASTGVDAESDAASADAASPDALTMVDASDASASNADCPPCAAMYMCVASPSGVTQNLSGQMDPDGTCHLAGLTLLCGGTGTAANGASLTWRVTAPDSAVQLLSIDTGGIQLDCSAQ